MLNMSGCAGGATAGFAECEGSFHAAVKRAPHLKNRKGMAIVIALAFSFCLLIMVVGMWVSQRNVSAQNRTALQQQQAFFAARSAMQHFLVKSRLSPTELYDAVSFTAGKNPLFVFSEYPQEANPDGSPKFIQADEDSMYITGPFPPGFKAYSMKKSNTELAEPDKAGKARYLYLAVDGDNTPKVFIRLGSYYNPMFRFLHSSLVNADISTRSRYIDADKNALKLYGNPAETHYRNKFLEYYLRDCTNATAPAFLGQNIPSDRKLQPMLVILKAQNAAPRNWKLGETYSLFDPVSPEQFPYTMVYRVANISIAAMKELKKYGEEAIQVEVEGLIIDFQGKVFRSRQVKTQKITRRGTL